MHRAQTRLIVGIGTMLYVQSADSEDTRVLFLFCSFQFQFLNEGHAHYNYPDKVGESFQ